MLCQLCNKNEAKVHLTKIINNTRVDMFVCEQCAKQHAVIDININDFLSSILGLDRGDFVKQKEEQVCSCCGMTTSEYNKTGKIGCKNCYDTFNDSIKAVLQRVHGNVKHNGKIPKAVFVKIEKKKEIEELKEKIKQCISTEEYEEAAKIRDMIRKLEEKREG